MDICLQYDYDNTYLKIYFKTEMQTISLENEIEAEFHLKCFIF